jgi:predicted RNA-binding Zn-ribbon protein involved in translation (DUF1610 family)
MKKEKIVKALRTTLLAIMAFSIVVLPLIGFIIYPAIDYNHGVCTKCGHDYTIKRTLSDGDSILSYRCENCGHSWFGYEFYMD